MGLLHEVPIAGGRALRLYVEGDTARLVLFDAMRGVEVFSLPFAVTVAALRAALAAALRAVARIAPAPVDPAALWSRVNVAWRRVWDFAPDDPDGDPDQMTASAIAGQYPGEEELVDLVASGQGVEAERRVNLMERRVAAASRGMADLSRVPLEAHVAAPGSFAAFLTEIERREAAQAAQAAQRAAFASPAIEPRRLGSLPVIYNWYRNLPSSYRVSPRDFTSPVVISQGSWNVILTPRAAGSLPWSTIFSYLRLEPKDLKEWLMDAVRSASAPAMKQQWPADVPIDVEIRWALQEPPTRFIGSLNPASHAVTLDVPKSNTGEMGEVVAEHIGMDIGLHHHAKRRR